MFLSIFITCQGEELQALVGLVAGGFIESLVHQQLTHYHCSVGKLGLCTMFMLRMLLTVQQHRMKMVCVISESAY